MDKKKIVSINRRRGKCMEHVLKHNDYIETRREKARKTFYGRGAVGSG